MCCCSGAGRGVEEDGMWTPQDGTADSSRNHKNWNSGAARSGRFITKYVSQYRPFHIGHPLLRQP